MTSPAQLSRLIRELRGAASPVQRLKLLGLGWRTLRGLSTEQRRQIASQLGFEGAEEIVENLASRRGLSPARLLQTVGRLKNVDAARIEDVVEGLRDPRRRRDLLRRGLEAVERRLGDAAAEPEAAPPEAAPPEAAPPEAAPLEAAPPQAAPPEATAEEVELEQQEVEAPIPTPVSAPRPEPVPRPAVATVAAAVVATPPVRRAEPAREPERPEPTPQRHPEADSIVDRLHRAPTLMERFRILRLDVDQARGLDVQELSRLLDAFPTDWSRRRALDALLRAHVPGDLQQAIFLIESVPSPRGRHWCVSTLLDEWELSDHERSVLGR